MSNVPFTTKRQANPTRSRVLTIKKAEFNQQTRTIMITGSDKLVRECRIDKLTSLEYGRELWKQIQTLMADKTPVTLVAAGGFSTDRWFYDAEMAVTSKDVPF